MKPTLLILAAGMGSRYGSLKQLDRLGPSGETIIDYSIYDAIQSGFGKLVFVIRKNIEKEFKEVLLSKYQGKIEIDYAFQELDELPQPFKAPKDRVKPWGTAHAILSAKDKINEPFLVINGDDFYGRKAYQVCSDFLQNTQGENEYCMPSYFVKNTLSDNGSVSRGVCELNEDGYLQGIVERKNIVKDQERIYYLCENNQQHPLTGEEYCSMNMFGFQPSFFAFLEKGFVEFLEDNIHSQTSEYLIPSVVNDLLQEQKITLKVLPNDSQWFGVTYKEDKQKSIDNLADLVKNGVYPEQLYED